MGTRLGLAALFAAGCTGAGSGADMALPDLAEACVPTAPDGGTCTSSPDCPAGSACVGSSCAPLNACAQDCGCTLGRTCYEQLCTAPGGQLCGPCGTDCDGAGGQCKDGYCATPCDETKTWCPIGYRCDIANMATRGYCVPSLTTGCAGCAYDADCPAGEVCNQNNRRCVPTPLGPDARLEMTALDFLFDDGMGNLTLSRNLQWTLGFYSRRDPAFDPYALAPGTCGSERSTFDLNAPFPVGPLLDAGDPLTLVLPSRSIPFARSKDPDPNFGFDYQAADLMVADWSPGPASWSGPGGAGVGAFTAMGAVPLDFKTTPDVLAATPVPADVISGVTVMFDAAAPAGVATLLEVSWNEGMGNTVTALVQIACRAPDGAQMVSIPGSMLAQAPRGQQLGLQATRATVATFQTKGVQSGRAVWSTQAAGAVVVAP